KFIKLPKSLIWRQKRLRARQNQKTFRKFETTFDLLLNAMGWEPRGLMRSQQMGASITALPASQSVGHTLPSVQPLYKRLK
ncbi:MAG TPA: hypothetical protein DEP04_07595, partial [Dehalococcoidia bacterium]|nr:hypothetical protein [Dehalococcoidia bacterium]